MSDQSANCQYCGYPLSPSAKFCAACGQPVKQPGSAASAPTPVMPQGYEDIGAPQSPTISPAETTAIAPKSSAPSEPPHHEEIHEYPVVMPSPPPKKSRTGLIIGLILGGGLLCLITMTVVGYLVVTGIARNLKPTGEAQVVTEVFSQATMAEATFEPIPLEPTSGPSGGIADVTLEPIDSVATPEKPSVLTGAPEGQMARDAIIVDDFETDGLEWSTASDEISVHQYEDGAYTINVLEPEYIAWTEVPVDFYPNFTEFDAWVPGDGDGGTYGVLCHYANDNDYYYVEIDPSEEAYSIGHYLDSEYNSLTTEDWPYTNALNPGSAVNRVYVACEQGKITLFLNDQFVDQVALAEPASPGAMAIFASTWDDMPAGGYKVFFDNFTAWKPVD